MHLSSKALLALALFALTLAGAGCSINSPQNSSIPWNHPADWEGQMPGMNPNGGAAR